MGMYCSLWRLEEPQLEEVLKDSTRFSEFTDVLPENADVLLESANADLDKAWHGIHFLLTGSAYDGEEPLCYLMRGGEFCGAGDDDPDGSRVLRPHQIAAFDEALQKISTDEFRKRFDPPRMMEEGIYPDIWDRNPEEDDTLGYLVDHFESLKNFVRKAHENKQGLMIYIG